MTCARYYGAIATRDNFIGRMYNITRNTNLNYNNCDWANATCAVSDHMKPSPHGLLLGQKLGWCMSNPDRLCCE